MSKMINRHVGWDAILTTTTLSQLIHRNIPQPDGTFKVAFGQDG